MMQRRTFLAETTVGAAERNSEFVADSAPHGSRLHESQMDCRLPCWHDRQHTPPQAVPLAPQLRPASASADAAKKRVQNRIAVDRNGVLLDVRF
jgi:hypothetical protein